MAKTNDFTKYINEAMAAFPVDMSAYNDAFKTSAAMGEKFSKVALEAAEKSTEISTQWTKDTLAKLEKRMEEIVAGICSAAGAQYRFEFINTFYPTVNSAAETEHAIRAAQQVLGADNVNGSCDPFTISEDFSSMLRVKPGCYGLLGNGVDSVGGCALHNPNYDFNDRILPLGARYWIQLVQDQLV